MTEQINEHSGRYKWEEVIVLKRKTAIKIVVGTVGLISLLILTR